MHHLFFGFSILVYLFHKNTLNLDKMEKKGKFSLKRDFD